MARPTASRWQRLNFFQRMMLRWRDLHPYNPVHVVRVAAPLDAARLRDCIDASLQAAALTGVELDRQRWRLRFVGGPAQIALEVVQGAAETQLAQLIEREFNRPFAAAAQPFRFVALAGPAAFTVLLAYDHYIAAGDPIARLLTHIVASYTGTAAPARPLRHHTGTYRHVLWRQPMAVLRALFGLPRWMAQARAAYRFPRAAVETADNACTLLEIDSARTQVLVAMARDWGVTLNDLLMAALLRALSPLAQARHAHPRRNQLAVASILNMRVDRESNAAVALSPLLAAFRVSHRVPDGMTLHELALQVRAQSSRAPRGRQVLQSLLGLGLSALVWPWLNDAQRLGFYPKHFPAWGGVTSLNVDAITTAQGGASIDYLRAVPTGPLCPLVLAATQAQKGLHLVVAYRRSAFAAETVALVGASLLRDFEHLAPCGQA